MSVNSQPNSQPSSQPSSRHSSQSREASTDEVVDWTELGQRMWNFLTGREAAIHYRFEEMAIEVPRDTGSEAPRATWKLNGTLTVTTSDDGASAQAVG